jgi:transposase InsO family protein
MGTMKFTKGVSRICREQGINLSSYYLWKNQFLESGKDRLMKRIKYHDIWEEIITLRNERTRLKRELKSSHITNGALRFLLSTGITIQQKNKQYAPSDKEKIVNAFLSTDLPRRSLCKEIGLAERSVKNWIKRYKNEGYQGLVYKTCSRPGAWNKTPQHVQDIIQELTLKYPYMGATAMRWHLLDHYNYNFSVQTVYKYQLKFRPMQDKPKRVGTPRKFPRLETHRIHEQWLTDFTYLKFINRKWVFLSAVLDDYSRYILGWHLSLDVSSHAAICCLEKAIKRANLEQDKGSKCIILTDRGPCYKSQSFESYCKQEDLIHKMCPPRTPNYRAKIERWFKTIKFDLKHTECNTADDLTSFLETYVNYYNNERCHQALDFVRPADIYFDRKQQILTEREEAILAGQQSKSEQYISIP